LKLYIKTKNGIEQTIGQPLTYEDSKKMINDFFTERNIISNYQRIYKDGPNRLKIDFGSYIDVIILEGSYEELKEVLNHIDL
jgi:hypothetical protein